MMFKNKERPFIMGLFSEEGSKKQAKPLAKTLDKEGYGLYVANVGSKRSDDEVFRKVRVERNHEALKRVKLKHELRKRGLSFSKDDSTDILETKLKDGSFMGFTGD